MNAIQNNSNLINSPEGQPFNYQQNMGNDQQGEFRYSLHQRQSDSAGEAVLDSMRGKKKSQFNNQQFPSNQLQQQQMQMPNDFSMRMNRNRFMPIFKNFPYFKNSHNAFDYINPQDKYRTWRDTHIDSLECFIFFCQSLLANQTLQELKIGDIQYCDILIEELCATLSLMPSLKYLDLSNMSLDCLSWRCLSKYVGVSRIIERINLQNNQITDECIRDFFNCFRNNSALQELNLSYCKIEQGHVNILLRLLSNNKSIRKVNLSNGTLNDENAEGIAEFLSNCVKIQLLDISDNNLGHSFFDRLNQNLSWSSHKKPKIHTFDIGSNRLNSSTAEKLLSNNQESSKNSSKCIEALISILKKLNGVYRLNISNTFLETDDIMRLNIEANKSKRQLILEELDLSFNQIERNFPENFFQHLKLLNLKKNNLSLSSVEVIARTLKDEQTKWEVLDISGNKINNSGLEILINYLKENNKLKELYCSENDIEGVGMISIIINNERMNLNKIDLSQNKFTLNSIISYLNSLKNQSLNKIVLKNFDDVIKTTQKNHLINESKIIFDQPFSLDLQKSTILAQHVFKGFERHLPKLNQLNVAQCLTLNEEDMKRLSFLISKSHTLIHLNLEGINLGNFSDQCLINLGNAFSENRCLKELNFSKCKLGTKFDKVAKDLGNINSLVDLNLSDNDLNDTIANILQEIIQKCFHLNHINLSKNSVGNGCIHAIIRGFKGNSSLQKLSMSQTEVTAGELLSFSQLLQNCGHLKNLDISSNKLLDVNLFTMNSLELKPESIVLDKKKIVDQYQAHYLKLMMEDNETTKQVVFNELDLPKMYTSKILEQITKMGNLQKLCIRNPVNQIDSYHLNNFLNQILNMPKLQKLQFSKLQISFDQFNIIATLLQQTRTLKTLSISEENITQTAITALSNGIRQNKTLLTLKLNDCNISQKECTILAPALLVHPTLEKLNVNGNLINSEGVGTLFSALSKLKTFKYLHFSQQKQTDGYALTYILKEVNSNFEYITKLNLSYNQFTSDNFEEVLEELKNHQTLAHIDLSGNPINEKGAKMIKSFLTINVKLKQLILSNCGLELESFKEISQGLSQNDVLEMLDLSSNTQEGDNAVQFFANLVYPKGLKLFLIYGNKITQQGNMHLFKFMKSCEQRLFIVNDWIQIQDDVAIQLLNNLIDQHSKDKLIPSVPRHYYTCIDFSRGQLTDKFCMFFTQKFKSLSVLECLNLEKNYHITQTGMKHVFTAVFDNRKNFDINLIYLNFSQREDDFLAALRNQVYANSQEKNQRKPLNGSLGVPNSNVLKQNNNEQIAVKGKEKSIWQKITLYFQRKLQFINDKITSQHEYKFDYCNLEKINLLKYQTLLIFLLAGSFIVQIILSIMPFISQAILFRSVILAVSLFIVLCEFISYCVYLYYVNMSEDIELNNKLNFLNKLKIIFNKIKYFDVILLVRGLARRADFILTNYIAIFYFMNNLKYLQEVYILFLSIKGLVILFFALSPFYDWCFKKRNQLQSVDKQFLDVGERLSMVFGMSLVEQIFQLFNPGASSVLSFKIMKQSQRQVINIWNKKVYEYIYLAFYITPLLVLYGLFYDLFVEIYEKQILQLAFAVLAICFVLSVFTIFTTRPTYIQQADFNEILNIRKFYQIEQSRTKNRSSTIRQTLLETLVQRNYFSQESYYSIACNYNTNTQFKRLIREEIIKADINNNDFQIEEQRHLIQNGGGSNKMVRLINPDIQDSISSIPIEVEDIEFEKRDTHNVERNLKKLKNE
ncbi:transmembrane protein, putative (macronuclear) [Tetrahymena thermophila SB210]|uniref:Transmembrane protein, putative n=1 Tax=Tetrahymena thermophila (strain SB210) TaxID=312017 RepID=I7LW79_TETTS|nr:transmembrane protein, putative [Tetrahymena thermophila SB210]EAS01121.2 transmembrane protein, putative [Tetrahymena thermophila SB210]|eukprot:XP_001021366.2 transmembrane protein, putative [Tetrahymena thermophila SB210]